MCGCADDQGRRGVASMSSMPPSHPDLPAIASLRRELWDAGYRPIAVCRYDHPDPERAGKAPLDKAWAENARHDPPRAAEFPAVAHQPNTGILCDGLRALDLDID